MNTQLQFHTSNGCLRFNGSTYDPDYDTKRLTGQLLRIFDCISDGNWRTLSEIESVTGAPQASISAQLRNLRKPRFGAYKIERQNRGERSCGLFEYRLAL